MKRSVALRPGAPGRVAGLTAACAAVGIALAGCGSQNLPPAAPPTNPSSLRAPPAHPPANLVGLAQLEAALSGVASCHAEGGTSATCALVTVVDHPFQLTVFPDAAAKATYLTALHADDVQAQARGVQPNGALVGGDWAAVPKVGDPGLLPTLRVYLGGQPFS